MIASCLDRRPEKGSEPLVGEHRQVDHAQGPTGVRVRRGEGDEDVSRAVARCTPRPRKAEGTCRVSRFS